MQAPVPVVQAPVTKVVYVPKPVPMVVSPSPPNLPPHSSVMRAVASANERAAADKVQEERRVADKQEKVESQEVINESINESVKQEEQRVIEDANRRMAEVHNRKAEYARAAAEAIDKASAERAKKVEEAQAEEAATIKKVVSDHSSNVVK